MTHDSFDHGPRGVVRARIALIAVLLAWIALAGLTFVAVRPELGYAYGHWLGGFGRELPALTAHLSLPVLGSTYSLEAAGRDPVFWLVWGFVFGAPVLLLWRSRRATTLAAVVELMAWTLACAVLAATTALLVGFGLWLPFSAA